MSLPPYAKLRVSIDGAPPQTGALVCAGGATIDFSAESTVGWSTLPRWEIYGYPPGFTAPAGWSTDANGVIFSTANPPPQFTLPAVATRWGKWLPRLIVNQSSIDPDTGAGTPVSSLVDSSTAFQTKSPNGIADLADGESNQFRSDWSKDHQDNLRTIDATLTAALAGGGGTTYAVSPVGAITLGQVCASYGTAPTVKTIQVATPAVLAAGSVALFMATAPASAGASVTAGGPGDKIANSVTGLGVGAAGPVGIDPTTFKAVRLLALTGVPEIGTCNTAGDVTLSAGTFAQRPIQPFNSAAAKYGATYGQTSNAAILKANMVAANRMLADMRLSNTTGAHQMFLGGMLYLPDTLWADRPIKITGYAGGANALGPCGIVGTGNDEALYLAPGFDGGIVEEISINAVNANIHAMWHAANAYTAGQYARQVGNGKVRFRCILGGTSGSTVPTTFTKPNPLTPRRFSFGAMHAVGDVIFPSRTSSRYGFYAYTITSSNGNSTPGTLGYVSETTEPTWPTSMAITGATSGSGGVVKLQTGGLHGYATGDSVTIASVGGTTEANGTFVVTYVDKTHFSLNGTTFVHAYTSGGTASTGGGSVVSGDLTFAAHALYTYADPSDGASTLATSLQLSDGAGDLTWIPESISGIVLASKATIRRVSINNHCCHMINAFSQTHGPVGQAASIIGSKISGITGSSLGAGIYVHGDESSNFTVSDVNLGSLGFDPTNANWVPGFLGNAFEDDSILGVVWKDPEVETAVGSAFISSTRAPTTWLNRYSDGNFKDNIDRGNALIINGTDTGIDNDGSAIYLGPRNIGSLNINSPNDLRGAFPLHAVTLRGSGTGVFAWGSSHENGGLNFFETRHDNFNYGWYFNSYCVGGATSRVMTGYSGLHSIEGLGNEWAYNGQFRGPFGANFYEGYGPDTSKDTHVRFGRRVVGDRYRSTNTPVCGGYTHKIVVAAGSVGDGTVWSAGASYSLQDYGAGTAPTCISPGDGYTYMWAGAPGGVTGGSPPTWSASTITGPRARRWAANQVTYPGDLWHDGVNHYFETANPTFWSAALPVTPNTLIGVRAANAMSYDFFQPNIQKYTVGATYDIGAVLQPSSGTGLLGMQVTAIKYRGVTYTGLDYAPMFSTTGAEPTWPVVAGGTVTSTFDSQTSVTYTAIQLTTGSTTPKWSYPFNTFTLEPSVKGILDGNFCWKQVTLTTGPSEPTWVTTTPGTSLTADTGTIPFSYLYDSTFNPAAYLADGTGFWMRIGPVPQESNIGGRIKNAGTLSRSVAGSSNVVLTAYEANYEDIVLTGALTGNITVSVPAVDGWSAGVTNSTTGAFTLTLIAVAGSGVVLSHGFRQLVSCNGTDVVADAARVGTNDILSKSVAGNTDVTLTYAESAYEQITLTGVLTGNINVIWPYATSRPLPPIFNNTSGAFSLTVKTAAGTGIAVTQAKRQLLAGDGTNIVALAAAI